MAAQVALSLVLVVGAGLFLATLRNLTKLDPGFEAAGLATVDAEFGAGPAEGRFELAERVLEELRQAPGVEGACSSL